MEAERPITVQTKVGELLDTYPEFEAGIFELFVQASSSG